MSTIFNIPSHYSALQFSSGEVDVLSEISSVMLGGGRIGINVTISDENRMGMSREEFMKLVHDAVVAALIVKNGLDNMVD